MTPPILTNDFKYSSHEGKSLPIAILTRLDSHLLRILIILSTRSSFISRCLFLMSLRALIESMLRQACPLPLNSSSILNSQVLTYRLLAISLENYRMNSCSSQISTAQIGVGTSASWNTFLQPLFVLYRLALLGSPQRIGTASEIESLRSSDEGSPGTMQAYFPLIRFLILLTVLGEYVRI